MDNKLICKCTDCEKVFFEERVKGRFCPLATCQGELEIIDEEDFLEDC